MTKRNRKNNLAGLQSLPRWIQCKLQVSIHKLLQSVTMQYINLSITMQYIYSSIYQPVFKCQMLTKKSAILGMFNSTKGVGSMWDEWVHGCYHEVEPKFFLFYIRPYFLTIPNTSDCAIWKTAPAIFLQIQMSSGIKKSWWNYNQSARSSNAGLHKDRSSTQQYINLQYLSRSNNSVSNAIYQSHYICSQQKGLPPFIGWTQTAPRTAFSSHR